MPSAWTITSKDLYLLSQDRRSFSVLLMLPLVFIVIIGLTTGQLLGWRSSNQVLKIAVLDQTDYDAIGSAKFLTPPDGSAIDPPEPLSNDDRERQRRVARHLVAGIVNGMQRRPGVELRTVAGWQKQLTLDQHGDPGEAARVMLADEQINALLVFAPDFYRRVYHLDIADLGARTEGGSAEEKLRRAGVRLETSDPESMAATTATAVLAWEMRDVIEPILFCRSQMAQELSIAERGSARYRRLCGPVNRMDSTPPPDFLAPESERDRGPGASVYEELVPSYTVMFVFFIVNVMAHSFLHERQIGTLRRLWIAPISGWSILVGKTVPFLLVSLTQSAILFIAGRLLFGMSWGPHPWMLVPVILATSAAAVGLGLLIATLVKSDSQVSAYATTVVIILAGISGCFMPRQWLPDVMQQISLATPHAWALIAYDQLLSTPTPNLERVWRCVGMLFGFSAAFLAVGGFRFRTVD